MSELNQTLLPLQRSDRAIAASSKGFAALCIALVAISISAILVRLSEQEISPYATAFHRFWITTVLLKVWLDIQQLRSVSINSEPLNLVVLKTIEQPDDPPMIEPWISQRLVAASAFLAADLVLWAWSLTQTTVANSTLLANLTPLFTCLLSWLIWRKTISQRLLIGMGIAIVGVAVLETDGLNLAATSVQGDFAALLAAMFFGAHILLVEQLQTKLSSLVIVYRTSAIAAILTLPILILDTGQNFPLSWQGWGLLVALSVICQVLGQGLLVYSLTCLSPAFVSVVLLLDPVLASLMSWFLFAEPINLLSWIAFAIVLSGVYFSSASQVALKEACS